MIFWKKQNKKSASEEINQKLSELPQQETPQNFIYLLENYPLQQTTLSLEKILSDWSIDNILGLGKQLATLEDNKLFFKFIEQFFVCKEEPETVIFSLQILANVKSKKITDCLFDKYLEIFPAHKVDAIFSIAVRKEHPDAETIALMSGTCAIPFLWLWQKTLKNRQSKIRLETTKILGLFPWQQTKIAGLLVSLLEDKKSEICKAAAFSLARLGKYAVPSLIKTLVKKDSRTRTLAIWSLGKIGEDAANAIPYLVSSLSDEDTKVVRNAKWALENIGESARDSILESLAAVENAKQRIALLSLVANFPPSEDIVEILLNLIDKPNDDSREAVIRCLGKMKDKAKPAIKKLKKLSKSKIPAVKLAAIFALSQIEDKHQDLHPMLFQLCSDESPDIRQEAIQLTVNIAKKSSKTQRILMQSLDDKDNKVKKSAIESLPGLPEVDKKMLSKLRSYLLEDDRDLRLAIMKTMLDLDVKDYESIGPLINILQSGDDSECNEYALLNLQAIGERSVIPLMKVLGKNTKLRKQISNTIAEISEPAVPKLLGLLKGKNANIRKSAIKILERIGQPAIPGLVNALKEDNFWIKKAATIALINIKENVSEQLVELLKSDNKEWRQAGLAVLKEIHIDTLER
ncbi:HEAT repeat domain-containing protein [Candidatus Uabimicrobium amorphum]|uniref:HEAT repeat-containing PBS lyase n=1 Tax=Uabimicrobium amorphum TaxID=2596890 RepID=A0A5S9ILF5_UABAM|nr:HEAT repeat domain-containing protein [Candidatus Uabimicrobium amorphum]BBM83710.1 HEAT repeat-containing PBS lyase [Candidatus Uabimicrobium amorphum]